MAIKDLDTSENIDRGIEPPHHGTEGSASEKGPQEGVQETEGVKIKNAHAAGSGSIGRNESSLPEDDKADTNKKGTGY